MSTAELIEQIKALPPAELEMVRNFLLNGEVDSADSRNVKYAPDEQFNQAAARVFEKHDVLLRKLAQ